MHWSTIHNLFKYSYVQNLFSMQPARSLDFRNEKTNTPTKKKLDLLGTVNLKHVNKKPFYILLNVSIVYTIYSIRHFMQMCEGWQEPRLNKNKLNKFKLYSLLILRAQLHCSYICGRELKCIVPTYDYNVLSKSSQMRNTKTKVTLETKTTPNICHFWNFRREYRKASISQLVN